MTIKDNTCSNDQTMAKKQKVDADDCKPISDEMLGAISIAMDSKADMNIVEFSYDFSDTDITPGAEPISDSELPPRIKKDKKKKKKKHSKEETSQSSQNDNSKDKHEQTDSKSNSVFSKN